MYKRILIMIAIAIFAIAGIAVAGELPDNGQLANKADGEIQITVAGGKVTIAVPVLSDQIPLNTKWHLHESHATTDGNTPWPLDTAKDYSLYNTERNLNILTAAVDLPNTNFVWYRVWGSDNKNWLYINPGSKYHRLDKKGKPGYEFVVDTRTGEVLTVSANYDVRP